jgi:hypothetical protein
MTDGQVELQFDAKKIASTYHADKGGCVGARIGSQFICDSVGATRSGKVDENKRR